MQLRPAERFAVISCPAARVASNSSGCTPYGQQAESCSKLLAGLQCGRETSVYSWWRSLEPRGIYRAGARAGSRERGSTLTFDESLREPR